MSNFTVPPDERADDVVVAHVTFEDSVMMPGKSLHPAGSSIQSPGFLTYSHPERQRLAANKSRDRLVATPFPFEVQTSKLG